MTQGSKKLALLSALKKLEAQGKVASLSHLMRKLGNGFVERSVRRWLIELTKEGVVQKIGEKRGTHYSLITVAGNTSHQNEIIKNEFVFSMKAQKSIQVIQKPLFKRKPVTYNAEWLTSYKPNHTFYLKKEQRDALKSLGNPEKAHMPAGTYARKIYNRLLIDLSYNSSRLEGNTYSLGETEKLIFEDVSAVGKLSPEKVMILNHGEAIRYLVENSAKLEINFTVICTLHYLLSDGLVAAQDSGKVRDHSVKIGQSSYIPVNNKDRLTKQLHLIFDVAKKINEPYEQSFFLLVHIAYLQAFTDVNKRTARLSANIPLIKNNLYPIAFSQIEKEDYISAMIAIYELNDPTVLAELYTFSCFYTAQQYDALKSSQDVNETRVQFRSEIRSIIRDVIVKKLSQKSQKSFIEKAVLKAIPKSQRDECVHIILEDLAQMGIERIQGLGITPKQLSDWKKARKNDNP